MAYEKDSKFEVVKRLKQKNKESRHQKKTARKSGFGEHAPLPYDKGLGPLEVEVIEEIKLQKPKDD